MTFASAGVVLAMTLTGTPAAAAAGWSAPDRISTTNFVDAYPGYSALSMAVDAAGKVHAAITGVGRQTDGIWYATNLGSDWAFTKATHPAGSTTGSAPHDFDPSVALDVDGSVSIAFTRIGCTNCAPNPSDGVSYITKAGGMWSNRQLLTHDWANNPSLVVRNGHIYLAYAIADYERQIVKYGTDHSGDWMRQKVTGAKLSPDLMLGSNGIPHLVAIKAHRTLGWWDGDSARTFGTAQTIPDGPGKPGFVLGALDSNNRPTVAWTAYDASWESIGVYVSSRRHGVWTSPQALLDSGRVVGLEVDGTGKVHVLVIGEDESLLYYFSKANGLWGAQPLYEGNVSAAALAVDADGQAHVMFTVGKSEPDVGLYYMAGLTT